MTALGQRQDDSEIRKTRLVEESNAYRGRTNKVKNWRKIGLKSGENRIKIWENCRKSSKNREKLWKKWLKIRQKWKEIMEKKLAKIQRKSG